MTLIYERDLSVMKYAILTSPYHKRVVSECAGMLEIPPMMMRRILIDKLDMMMLESIGARFESWINNANGKEGFTIRSGSLLFGTYIPVILEERMKQIAEQTLTTKSENEGINLFRRLLSEEMKI
jgi:energy-converting hydrogenase A subunit M